MCLTFGVLVAVLIAIAIFTRRIKDLSPEGRSLFLATLVVEQACVFTRLIIASLLGPALLMPIWFALFIVAGVLFLVTKHLAVMWGALLVGGFILGIFALICALGPVIWAMLHIMGLTGSGKFDRWAMKARTKLSAREKNELILALSQFASFPNLKVFSNVYVMSSWTPLRFEVIGTDLYIAKALLHGSPHLTAVLAHALGWINAGADGRLVAALRRLVVPPIYILSWCLNDTAPGNMVLRLAQGNTYVGFIATSIVNGMLALAGGGWGSYLLTPWWSKYWDSARYRHDAFAKALGQKQGMIDYLEHASFYSVPTPYILFPEEADMELRIDELMK